MLNITSIAVTHFPWHLYAYGGCRLSALAMGVYSTPWAPLPDDQSLIMLLMSNEACS